MRGTHKSTENGSAFCTLSRGVGVAAGTRGGGGGGARARGERPRARGDTGRARVHTPEGGVPGYTARRVVGGASGEAGLGLRV